MEIRKAWSCFFTLLMVWPAAFAQELTVLPDPFEGGAPKEMTTRYLRNLARHAVEKRRLTFEGLKNADDILAYQQRLRRQFVEKLGGFPDKTPLNARIVGTIKGDGYRVENVLFESRPKHYVAANFYVPDGKGPHPGAILSCGHSNLSGKAAYQLAGILAAKHGIAVLCYDPIGQGERFQMLNADGTPRYKLSTSEHSHVGVSCILVGQNAATYRVWDGMRALDYLESRPDIIKGKYGCTGISATRVGHGRSIEDPQDLSCRRRRAIEDPRAVAEEDQVASHGHARVGCRTKRGDRPGDLSRKCVYRSVNAVMHTGYRPK